MSIGVILNGYKRPQNIYRQLEALNSQSIKPDKVKLWYNNPLSKDVDKNLLNLVPSAYSSENLGVWARFAYALNLDTEYIAMFDDDTLPGSNWFKNCLDSMKIKEGIYGTVGCKMFGKESYLQHNRYGWPAHNTEIVEVDFVGHAWFFKREWLYAMFKYPIKDLLGGEDMQLSFAAKKDLGIKTYVPPHPINNMSLWGSLQAYELGVDGNAISQMPGFLDRFHNYFIQLRDMGWKFVYEEA